MTYVQCSYAMWTISLVLIALAFGGALEKTGCLQSIMSKVSSFKGLQTSATFTFVATNLVAGDHYLSIALPGRMYAPVYRGMKYLKLNLSPATVEGGTLISLLIPWNAGGAFVVTALGLGISDGNFENLLYIPLAFVCWVSPVLGLCYAQFGWFSPKATDAEVAEWQEEGENIAEFDERGRMTSSGIS